MENLNLKYLNMRSNQVIIGVGIL